MPREAPSCDGLMQLGSQERWNRVAQSRHGVSSFFLAVVLTVFSGTAAAESPEPWVTAAAGGQYFAVGSNGVLLNSPDLQAWTLLTSGDFAGLQDVTWGNNLFVAVGNDTTIRTSADGNVWTTRLVTPSTGALLGVAWGGSRENCWLRPLNPCSLA